MYKLFPLFLPNLYLPLEPISSPKTSPTAREIPAGSSCLFPVLNPRRSSREMKKLHASDSANPQEFHRRVDVSSSSHY